VEGGAECTGAAAASLVRASCIAAALAVPSPLQQLSSTQPAVQPPLATPAERIALRSAVVQLLPGRGSSPAFVRDELEAAVESLEAIEHGPETGAFHMLGLAGSWALRALSEPEHASALEAFQMRTADLTVLGIEQQIGGDGAAAMAVDFELTDGDDGQLRGRLEVDGTLADTHMSDFVDLRTAARRLSMPRVPSTMSVDELMRVLHARLSSEFRAEDGVRIGLQTTYMDEELRVARCLTGKLRGECMVYVRRAPPEEQ